MKTPVVMVLFNRPTLTERVFREVAKARPSKLLIVCDGPRSGHPTDLANVAATRHAVEKVDWPCEVLRNYAELNMGCRQRVASGLTWVFSQVEEAIILEDDCLPHPSFFPYCETLLEYYRNEPRVMHISGDNFQFGRRRGRGSYYFSKYAHVWGWATWRRAWDLYDVNMSQWNSLGRQVIERWCRGKIERHYWKTMFKGAAEGRLDTWDYAWMYACGEYEGLSVNPNVNLVSNIGFGGNSTNTVALDSPFASLATEPMSFPLVHPRRLQADKRADQLVFETMFAPGEGLMSRIARRAKRILERITP